MLLLHYVRFIMGIIWMQISVEWHSTLKCIITLPAAVSSSEMRTTVQIKTGDSFY